MSERYRATVVFDFEVENIGQAATVTQQATQYGMNYTQQWQMRATILKIERTTPDTPPEIPRVTG